MFAARKMMMGGQKVRYLGYTQNTASIPEYGGTLSLPVPSGASSGKYTIAVVEVRESNLHRPVAPSTPSGWTSLGVFGVSEVKYALFTRVLDGTEGSSVAFSIGDTNFGCVAKGQMLLFSGALSFQVASPQASSAGSDAVLTLSTSSIAVYDGITLGVMTGATSTTYGSTAMDGPPGYTPVSAMYGDTTSAIRVFWAETSGGTTGALGYTFTPSTAAFSYTALTLSFKKD